MHRLGRILSTTLITAGLVMLVDAGITLLWQEPVSAAYGTYRQSQADGELTDLESSFSTDISELGDISETELAAALSERFQKQIAKGDPIGRIKIDSIGLDMVLMNGTDTATLREGPSRYPQTPLPGNGSTTGIAGHRTTYLAPFRRINEVEKGDRVRIELPYGTFNYAVEKHEIVDPSDVQIVDPVGYDRVVLTACHPLYSAAQRYAVFARLESIETFAVSDEASWPVL